jgi:hypothetical protein
MSICITLCEFVQNPEIAAEQGKVNWPNERLRAWLIGQFAFGWDSSHRDDCLILKKPGG